MRTYWRVFEESLLPRLLEWSPLGVLLLFCVHDWWGPDFWYHLFLGRGVWEQGTIQPVDNLIMHQDGYVNQYWLFQSVLFKAYDLFGYFGLRAVVFSIWFGTFWAWSGFFRERLKPAIAATLLVMGVVFFQHRVEYRPEICSYFFLSVCLRLVYGWISRGDFEAGFSWKPFALWAVLPWAALQWTWSNCHGYFFVGTVFAGLAMVGEFVERRKRSALAFMLLAVVGALAVLIPPLGYRSWWDFWHLFGFLKAMSRGIEEFLPSYTPLYLRSWTTLLFWVAWVATLALLPVSLRARGWFFRTGLSALSLYLSAKHYRNIPLLPLLSAPLWVEIALTMTPKFAEKKPFARPGFRRFLEVAPLVACLAMAWTYVAGTYQWSRFSESRMRWQPSSIAFPTQFRQYLEQSKFEGKLFNEPSDGGFLEFHFPKMKIYSDSRFVDVAPVTEYFRAASNPEAFEALHKKVGFDGTLLWILRQQELILHLMKHPDWRLVYNDLQRAFFVHRSSEAARNLPRVPANWEELDDWRHGDNRARIKQWLLFFSHMERNDEFDYLFSKLEERGIRVPDYGEIALRDGVRRNDSLLISRGEKMIKQSDRSIAPVR